MKIFIFKIKILDIISISIQVNIEILIQYRKKVNIAKLNASVTTVFENSIIPFSINGLEGVNCVKMVLLVCANPSDNDRSLIRD